MSDVVKLEWRCSAPVLVVFVVLLVGGKLEVVHEAADGLLLGIVGVELFLGLVAGGRLVVVAALLGAVALLRVRVAGHLFVLGLEYVHLARQLGLVQIGHHLWRHLDLEAALVRLDGRLDLLDHVLEQLDALLAVQARRRAHEDGRRDQIDLDRLVLGGHLEALAQSVLDGVDALVAVARDLDVGAALDRLRCEATLDVRDEDALPLGRYVALVEHARVGHALLEEVVGIAGLLVDLVQLPRRLLVQLLELLVRAHLEHLGRVAQYAVDGLAARELLLALDDLLGGDASLGQVDVALLLVHADDDDDLVAADADQLVDRADAATRELTQQHHALDLVVLEQADVRAHLGYLTHVHHHDLVALGKLVLVETTRKRHFLLLLLVFLLLISFSFLNLV